MLAPVRQVEQIGDLYQVHSVIEGFKLHTFSTEAWHLSHLSIPSDLLTYTFDIFLTLKG